MSDAMFLTWRAMFVHVKLMPVEFFNFMTYNARKGNSSIAIFGEAFHGRVDPLVRTCLTIAFVENMNGYVVCNVGYYAANIDYAIDVRCGEGIPNFKTMRNIGQVVGVCPYYCSKQNAKLPFEKQIEYKKIVEQALKNKGLMIVTYLNDGCDDHEAPTYGTTDNLVYWIKK